MIRINSNEMTGWGLATERDLEKVRIVFTKVLRTINEVAVSNDKQGYQCLGCRRHYPFEDGIIDLRMQ